MPCINHPNAITVATCTNCKVELCGPCTRYLELGQYCEKCATTAEADAYLLSRQRGEEKLQSEIAQVTASRLAEEEARQKSRSQDSNIARLGIGMASLMLFVSMGLYAFPNLFTSEQELAQQQDIIRLEECRQVFQVIGIALAAGNTLDRSMSCPGTSAPNTVTREGGVVKVAHPLPQQFGLDEFYVTSDSHQVVMVAAGRGS